MHSQTTSLQLQLGKEALHYLRLSRVGCTDDASACFAEKASSARGGFQGFELRNMLNSSSAFVLKAFGFRLRSERELKHCWGNGQAWGSVAV